MSNGTTDDELEGDEPVELPIDGMLDLHTIAVAAEWALSPAPSRAAASEFLGIPRLQRRRARLGWDSRIEPTGAVGSGRRGGLARWMPGRASASLSSWDPRP